MSKNNSSGVHTNSMDGMLIASKLVYTHKCHKNEEKKILY
jgi:hypothetical protein